MWQNITFNWTDISFNADLKVFATPHRGAFFTFTLTHKVIIKYIFKDIRKGSTCENTIDLFFIGFFIHEHIEKTKNISVF